VPIALSYLFGCKASTFLRAVDLADTPFHNYSAVLSKLQHQACEHRERYPLDLDGLFYVTDLVRCTAQDIQMRLPQEDRPALGRGVGDRFGTSI
jgi:hypothetical protein